MRDSLREEDSPRESIEIDKKSYSTVHTVHTVHSNSEKRTSVQIRMRKSIHETASRYCAFARMNIGQFYEEAVILFMDLNPMDGTLLIVERNERESCLDDQIEEVILIDEFEDAMRVLSPERKLHINKKKRLAKLLRRCQKLNQRGERLEELMKTAVSYLV